MTRRFLLLKIACLLGSAIASSQTLAPAPGRASILRGEYGPYRANNDLLSYHLDIRIDPAKKFLSGKNTIRFRMLKDGRRIQLDLTDVLKIDKIVMGSTPLKYQRDSGAVFVDFPELLKKGKSYVIAFYYSGNPAQKGRFGGFTFDKDPAGRDWVYSACEGIGASVWWPNKDQWQDEVEEMEISISAPSNLTDVSNGRFVGKKDLGDGYTQWNWKVHYPINNYDVAVNLGKYEHFSDSLGDLTLDYYVLPENIEKAKKQFSQTKGMLEAFQHYFGEYPFKKDGYKLIEVPYAGMEHQSAVAYGNGFENGYFKRDWTGVGISLRFDFIIIHESGHEWFGNAVSAADPSDMWIHEGWTTYLECLYCEYHYGKADALKYTNGLKSHVNNRQPILGQRGVNRNPPQDQYFKGALFINTLRSVVDDDKKWWAILRKFYQTFKYKNILTEDVVRFFNANTGMNLTPMFDQYLRHVDIPTLELKFSKNSVAYRWIADESAFAMPIKVGTRDHWQTIKPTTKWQAMPIDLTAASFEVATELFYVKVKR
jgi:aminopeptidase N